MVVLASPVPAKLKPSSCPTPPPAQDGVNDSPRSRAWSIDESLHPAVAKFMSPEATQRHFQRTSPMSRLEKDLLLLPLGVSVNRTQQLMTSAPYLSEGGVNLLTYYKDHVATAFQVLCFVCAFPVRCSPSPSSYPITNEFLQQSVQGTLAAYKCEGPYGANFSSSAIGAIQGTGRDTNPERDVNRLRADSLSYVLLEIMRSSLELVMAAPRRGGLLRDADAFLQAHNVMTTGRDSSHMPVDGAAAPLPSSVTDTAHLPNRRVKLPAPLACDPSSCGRGQDKPVCYTDIGPSQQHSLVSIVVGRGVAGGWKRIAPPTRNSGAGGRDMKYTYTSPVNSTGPHNNKDDDVITFDLHVTADSGYALLCEASPPIPGHGRLVPDALLAIAINVPNTVSTTSAFSGAKSGAFHHCHAMASHAVPPSDAAVTPSFVFCVRTAPLVGDHGSCELLSH